MKVRHKASGMEFEAIDTITVKGMAYYRVKDADGWLEMVEVGRCVPVSVFKVGDHVKAIKAYYPVKVGAVGVVRCVDRDSIGVEFVGLTEGHELEDDVLPEGSTRGWYMRPGQLEKI